MTIFTVLFLTLVSACLAQSASSDVKQRASRAPQSQILYSDPEGSRVDWKLYAPQNQWRSHLESSQRLQRAEKRPTQENYTPEQQVPKQQTQIQAQPQYQPYSAVPDHIKKLIIESYNHQGPYVDPGAFFYQAFAPISVSSLDSRDKDVQSPNARSEHPEHEYFHSAVNYRTSGYQENNEHSITTGQIGKVPLRGGIKYKDEERLTQRSAPSLPYGSVIGAQSREGAQYQPYQHISQSHNPQYQRRISDAQSDYSQYNKQTAQPIQYNDKQNSQPQQYKQLPQPQQYKAVSQPQQYKAVSQPQQYKQLESVKALDQNMPMAIQQLLSYQAQIPYNVIANHIIYRPKQLFIPKPLPESAKVSKQYPSKVYFLKTDGQIYDNPEMIKNGNKYEERY